MNKVLTMTNIGLNTGLYGVAINKLLPRKQIKKTTNVFHHSSGHPNSTKMRLPTKTIMLSIQNFKSPQKEGRLLLAKQTTQDNRISSIRRVATWWGGQKSGETRKNNMLM